MRNDNLIYVTGKIFVHTRSESAWSKPGVMEMIYRLDEVGLEKSLYHWNFEIIEF